MNKEETWLLREKYAGRQTDDFLADCARLAAGEPLAYLIGYVPFLSCQIDLTGRPLIPRVETEFWVERAISAIRMQASSLHILDLCAGSGCIGVAVAKAMPEAGVDFVEIDARLLPTITNNLTTNGVHAERSHVFHSDLFTDVPDTNRYHFILSNPPYIDRDSGQTTNSVLDFEPHLALFGGQDGLEIITNIIRQAPDYINPNGQLWLEHEPEQCAAIAELGELAGFLVSHNTDQYGIQRYSVLTLK